MKVKSKVKCSECGRLCSNIYGPNLDLCRICFNKSKFQTKIPQGPLIFDQDLSIQINLGSVNVTEDQGDNINQRLDYLFPDRPKNNKFSKMSSYLRLLILNDINLMNSQTTGDKN